MASILDMVFGQKPQVASFIPTDPLAELGTLLGGEIKDWPQIENLSNLYQTYMLGALNEAVPGFSDILKAGGVDTLALEKQALPLIEGKLPADVAAQVERSDAFQSLTSGTAGSPMAAGLTARDLGLTSLDLMNQGANLMGAAGNAAQRWAGIASGTILPPSANLYSPEWFSQFIAQQNAAKQATQQLRYNVAAAPDPAAAGISGTIMNLLGAYLGAGRGGGGGSITPSYASATGGFGMGGVNPYAATQGGFNYGPYNVGGSSVPYMGGGMPTDISNPGYPAGGSSSGFTPTNINDTFALPTAYNTTPYYGYGGAFNPTGMG